MVFKGSLNNHEAPLIRPCFPRGDLCIGRGGPLEFPWMAFGSCFSLHLGKTLPRAKGILGKTRGQSCFIEGYLAEV